MKKKFSAFLIAVVSLLSLIFITQSVTTQDSQAATNSSPVFFVPGAYSNEDSWDQMFPQLDPNSVHPVVKLDVHSNNSVTRTDVRAGNSDERPFVVIAFDDYLWNDPAVYANAAGMQQAIQQYKAADPFSSADIVAQSNGGNISTRWMEEFPSDMINEFITVGTPYNMRANNGDPADPLLLSQVAGADRLKPFMNVINVIGEDNGSTTTDGVVSRESSMDGSHIFDGNVASLRYLYLSGPDGLHMNQTSCPEMAQIISENIAL